MADPVIIPNVSVCPKCGFGVTPDEKFCPQCGVSLIPETVVGIGRQIFIYSISLFLPPLGLIWFFRYFKNPDQKIRRVGMVALIVTVVSIIFTVWSGFWFISLLQQQLNSYSAIGL
jgi:uncharacterized OB-fold protein